MQRPRPILSLMEHTLKLLGTRRATAAHNTGEAGERAAYFHLRRQGYTVVARQWRQPLLNGEVDLIAWEGETLCFVEVKTRSDRTPFAAEFAVDQPKRQMLHRMAQAYLSLIKSPDTPAPEARFDIVSVYLGSGSTPDIRLLRDAFR